MLIFISYRHKDWPFAQRLHDHLQQRIAGATVYIDRQIASDDFEKELLAKVRDCDIFILIITENTFDPQRIQTEGDWIRREVSFALDLDKPIALVLYEGLTPPPDQDLPPDMRGITRKHGIEFYGSFFNEGVDHLARHCANLVEIPTQLRPPISPLPKSGDLAEPRRLEVALPQKTPINVPTELRARIVLPGSAGLQGELSDRILPDVRGRRADTSSRRFPVQFPMDPNTGEVSPVILCLQVVADHFDVHYPLFPDGPCGADMAEVYLLPDDDSRTLIFNLYPKEGIDYRGSSRVTIRLCHERHVVAEKVVTTEIVDQIPAVVYTISTVILKYTTATTTPLPPPPIDQLRRGLTPTWAATLALAAIIIAAYFVIFSSRGEDELSSPQVTSTQFALVSSPVGTAGIVLTASATGLITSRELLAGTAAAMPGGAETVTQAPSITSTLIQPGSPHPTTPTGTAAATATNTPTFTPTVTLTSTQTPSATLTGTATATGTNTPTLMPTVSTQTATPSKTTTRTSTPTPSVTSTRTSTVTPTHTPTATLPSVLSNNSTDILAIWDAEVLVLLNDSHEAVDISGLRIVGSAGAIEQDDFSHAPPGVLGHLDRWRCIKIFDARFQTAPALPENVTCVCVGEIGVRPGDMVWTMHGGFVVYVNGEESARCSTYVNSCRIRVPVAQNE